jgi:Tfp pilus assembly protein PilX
MRPQDLQAPWKFVPLTHRGRSGFTLVLTVVMGVILTVLALTIMLSSMNEVKVASSQNIGTSALNAAESAGSVALNTLSQRGNSISFPTATTADQIIGYLCLDNPLWVSVELPKSSDTLRTTQYYSVAQENANFLNKAGTTASESTQAFDPLKMTPAEVASWSSATTASSAIIKKQGTSAQLGGSNLGIKGLSVANANCTTKQTSAGSPTAGYNYMPGNPGLGWTAAESNSAGNFVLPNQKISTIGDYQVCGQSMVQNFKLTMVEAVSDSTTNRHVPSGLFRLIYTYDLQSEGQIRVANANDCTGRVVGRQIIRAPNILIVDLIPPGSSFAQYSTFVDNWTNSIYFGGNEVYDGRTHTNTAPGFYFNAGEKPTLISGTFSTAGCRTQNSGQPVCSGPDAANGKYGTYFTAGSGAKSTDPLSSWATFQGGAKFNEDGGSYIPKPPDGGYQLKATLTGQADPSTDSNNDVMKLSEVRKSLGVQVTGTGSAAEVAPPTGVYWVNPTDPAAASSASGKATSYSDWLGKATSTSNTYNSTSNLLPGVYINGNVDYINMYAAKSSSTATVADVQVVEIKQGSSKYKFTMSKSSTKVAVDTGSGYGTENTYNKAMSGLFFVDGNVGDRTQNCNTGSSTRESCRGLISVPPDTSAASLPFTSGADTPTIQQSWGVTIAANGNVAIQDNLNYQTDPRGADKKFDNSPNTGGVKDDPPMSQAQNILGIVTFDQKKVKDANDNISATTINGSTYWGSGLKNQARVDTGPTGKSTVDAVDIQASLYGYSQGINSYNPGRIAEYIRILGGEIQTNVGYDFTDGCSSNVDLSAKGGSSALASNVCQGGRMYMTGDLRMQNGYLAPPAFPTILNSCSTACYKAQPVGRQSIGKIRWQTLPYQTL